MKFIYSGHKQSKLILFQNVSISRKSTQFTHQQMHYLLTWLKFKIYIKMHNNIASTCFGL